jgi:hypothetical protein
MTNNVGTQTWVRMGCVGLGVFAILQGVILLQKGIAAISSISALSESFSMHILQWILLLLANAAGPIALLAMGYLLIRHAPHLAVRLQRTSMYATPYWEPLVYKLVLAISGIVALTWGLSHFGEAVMNYIILSQAKYSRSDSMIYYQTQQRFMVWGNFIRGVIQILIGGYLLLGAPRLVKWQIRRKIAIPTAEDDEKERKIDK